MRRDLMLPLLLILAGAGIWYYTGKQRGLPNKSASTGNSTPTIFGGGYGMNAQARGIRNNNPGNIKISTATWKGKVPVSANTDGVFEQFTTPEYGIRALFIDIRSKIGRGLNTIQKIIEVYAPNNENDTYSYVAAVSGFTGIDVNQPLSVQNIPQIVPAIIEHENGFNPYTSSQYTAAYSLV